MKETIEENKAVKFKALIKEMEDRQSPYEDVGFWYWEGEELVLVNKKSSDEVKLRARKTLLDE